MAEIEKLQRALKKLVDLFFADLVWSEEFVQVEVWKAAVGHTRRQEFPQAAGINRSQLADFFKHHALQRIVKDAGVEQFANLNARSALDQHRAQKAQGVFLKLKSGVRILNTHLATLSRRARRKQAMLRDGASYEYDSLVVATGPQTSYYGNDSWRQWAPSLKSVEEATAIRHKILYAFEQAERAATPEEARAWLTFVIVGAGATGLELSGALAEIARETLRHDFRRIDPQKARIILMEGAPRVLGPFPEDLSAKAEKLVTRLGVEVIKGVMVTNIDGQGVTFKRGDSSEKLAANTVLWAGGVMATPFGRKLAERTKSESDRR